MNKQVCSVICVVLVGIGFLAGCQEESSSVRTFKGVTLLSNVVELANASFDISKNKYDEVIRVEVSYLFHNIAGRDLRVKVTASFYDEHDDLVATGGPKTIALLKNYTERVNTPANTISYEGPGIEKINHVILTVIKEE